MKRIIRFAVVLIFAALVLFFTVPFKRVREPLPQKPRPEDIADLIDKADRVVVGGENVAGYESSNRHDLDALKTALRIERPTKWVSCKCDGTQTITLYKGSRVVARFSNHHAKLLRCNLWWGDAPIADVSAFLAWFDARGVAEPRREYEVDLAQQRAALDSQKQWVAAMPSSLQPLWPDDFGESKRAVAALADQFPDTPTRIRVLFAWYGSGEGQWSYHRSYEGVPEKMLLAYPVSDLIAAANDEMTVAQTEGCARLFGMNNLGPLPVDLKRRLLQHCLANSRLENHDRAKAAFQ